MMDEFSAETMVYSSTRCPCTKLKKEVPDNSIGMDVGPLRMCIAKAVMDTSSFRNPLTIWERDHHLGQKAQAAMVQD